MPTSQTRQPRHPTPTERVLAYVAEDVSRVSDVASAAGIRKSNVSAILNRAVKEGKLITRQMLGQTWFDIPQKFQITEKSRAALVHHLKRNALAAGSSK